MPAAALSQWARGASLRAGALVPGVAICAVFALAATFVAEHQGGPQLLYALLFGMSFNFLHDNPRLAPGIGFTAKTALRLGVALLGARISLAQIVALGWPPLVVVLAGVLSTIAIGILCARLWGRGSTELGLLTGGAVAICGASAAMAISAVLPRGHEAEQRTLLTVVGVTALSTLAMVLYPPLARVLGMDAQAAGVFLGGTIHDVAQVVGAGLLFAPQAAETATVVKLLRVAMLVPVVFALSLYARRVGGAGRGGSVLTLLPPFLFGFVALVVLNSSGALPAEGADALAGVSRWCLVAAIAALGIRSSLGQLAALGWRPIALLVAETAWLAALVLAILWLLPLPGQ